MPFPRPATLTTVLPLALGVMLIDGYDLQVMALLVPVLAGEWGLAPADFGWVLAAPLFGLGIGAALLGPLGDRFGRRPVVLTGIAMLTLAVALSAMANGLALLGVSRFLTGLSLGIALPNISALVAEIAPSRSRAAAMTFVAIGVSLGGVLSGLLVPKLLPGYGWRGAYMLAVAVGCLVWLALWWKMPESPSFAAGVRRAAGTRNPYVRLFEGGRRRSTPIYWLFYGAAAFTLYLLMNWLPTLLTAVGWTVSEASHAIATFQAGGVVAGLVIAFAMDRWRPDLSLLTALAIAAVVAVAMAFGAPGHGAMLVLIALMGGAISGIIMVLPALAPFLYPPDLLSTGLGVTVAVGRIGAVGGPLAGAALIRSGMAPGHVVLVVLPAIAICAAATLLLRLGAAGPAKA